jgi:hypothetical protein
MKQILGDHTFKYDREVEIAVTNWLVTKHGLIPVRIKNLCDDVVKTSAVERNM